jgi:hypothetical protein
MTIGFSMCTTMFIYKSIRTLGTYRLIDTTEHHSRKRDGMSAL